MQPTGVARGVVELERYVRANHREIAERAAEW
jgi:hypothetical protein